MLKKLSALLMILLLLPCASLAEETGYPKMIPVELTQNATPLELNKNQKFQAAEGGFGADGMSYHDETLDVQIHKSRAYDTDIYIAYVQIAHPSQLRTQSAKPYPSDATANIMALCKSVRAVVATNADWFVYHNAGVIYRQGKLLRNRPHTDFDGLFVDMNGDFHIVAPLTKEGAEAVTSQHEILNSFCFGPALVIDGELCEIERDETFRQRTAIGQLGPKQYVMVVTDGPEEHNCVGLSVPQMGQLMYDLGAYQAYNLDGGYSSTMIFNNNKISSQKANRFRSVGDILYFATAIDPEAK